MNAPQVLIVEDNPVEQEVLKAYLNMFGCVSKTASDGMQAIEFIQNAAMPFDLILMDVQLPNMDGIEAALKIRSMGLGIAETPILCITAHAMAGDRERLIKQGMDDYLAKPYLRANLRECISGLIGDCLTPDPRAMQKIAC